MLWHRGESLNVIYKVEETERESRSRLNH